MKVEVRLYGSLRRYRPADAPGEPHTPFAAITPQGTTVRALSALLGIPDGLAETAAVNDEAVGGSAVLREGDKVTFFPPSAGGAARGQT
jgi:molybdopterin converting factor small subunit